MFSKMKVNENTIYIFLLGILAGIICMQCVNHFRKSPKDVYVDNFEYEKESLGILKREELKNEHYECLDQIAYWGTDSLDSFSLIYVMIKNYSFVFQRKHVLLVSMQLSI